MFQKEMHMYRIRVKVKPENQDKSKWDSKNRNIHLGNSHMESYALTFPAM